MTAWAQSLIRISNYEVETLQKRLAEITAQTAELSEFISASRQMPIFKDPEPLAAATEQAAVRNKFTFGSTHFVPAISYLQHQLKQASLRSAHCTTRYARPAPCTSCRHGYAASRPET